MRKSSQYIISVRPFNELIRASREGVRHPLVGKSVQCHCTLVVSCCTIACRNHLGERPGLVLQLIPKRGTGNGSLQPKRKGWMPTNRSHSRICDGHFVFWYVGRSAPGLDKAQVGLLISLLSILCFFGKQESRRQ